MPMDAFSALVTPVPDRDGRAGRTARAVSVSTAVSISRRPASAGA